MNCGGVDRRQDQVFGARRTAKVLPVRGADRTGSTELRIGLVGRKIAIANDFQANLVVPIVGIGEIARGKGAGTLFDLVPLCVDVVVGGIDGGNGVCETHTQGKPLWKCVEKISTLKGNDPEAPPSTEPIQVKVDIILVNNGSLSGS